MVFIYLDLFVSYIPYFLSNIYLNLFFNISAYIIKIFLF